MEFGYLDSAYSSVGKLTEVIEYAVLADELGISRFWLSEHHHDYSRSAWSNPQFLIPILLNMTERINVGMAGILINYYSPYEVAMNYKLVANLFPGRVDLGFANGTLPLNIAELLCQKELEKHPDDFLRKIAQLANMYNKEEEFRQTAKMVVPPYLGKAPDLFLLTSSSVKYEYCLQHKLQCAHSLFHSKKALSVLNKDEIDEYKGRFKELYGYTPAFVMAVSGLCGKSYNGAEIDHGGTILDKLAFACELVGPPELFEEKLLSMQLKYGVDEFVYLDCHKQIELKKEALYLLTDKFKIRNTQSAIYE